MSKKKKNKERKKAQYLTVLNKLRIKDSNSIELLEEEINLLSKKQTKRNL